MQPALLNGSRLHLIMWSHSGVLPVRVWRRPGLCKDHTTWKAERAPAIACGSWRHCWLPLAFVVLYSARRTQLHSFSASSRCAARFVACLMTRQNKRQDGCGTTLESQLLRVFDNPHLHYLLVSFLGESSPEPLIPSPCAHVPQHVTR